MIGLAIILLALGAAALALNLLGIGARLSGPGDSLWGFYRVPPDVSWGLLYRWHLFLGPIEVYRTGPSWRSR